MAKLTISGNVALVEYPECAEPEFDLKEDGGLFVFGYSSNFMGKSVGSALRFDFPQLKGFKILGRYSDVPYFFTPELANYIDQNCDKGNLLILEHHTL